MTLGLSLGQESLGIDGWKAEAGADVAGILACFVVSSVAGLLWRQVNGAYDEIDSTPRWSFYRAIFFQATVYPALLFSMWGATHHFDPQWLECGWEQYNAKNELSLCPTERGGMWQARILMWFFAGYVCSDLPPFVTLSPTLLVHHIAVLITLFVALRCEGGGVGYYVAVVTSLETGSIFYNIFGVAKHDTKGAVPPLLTGMYSMAVTVSNVVPALLLLRVFYVSEHVGSERIIYGIVLPVLLVIRQQMVCEEVSEQLRRIFCGSCCGGDSKEEAAQPLHKPSSSGKQQEPKKCC